MDLRANSTGSTDSAEVLIACQAWRGSSLGTVSYHLKKNLNFDPKWHFEGVATPAQGIAVQR